MESLLDEINILLIENDLKPLNISNINLIDFDLLQRLRTKNGENILHLIVKTNDYNKIKYVIDSIKKFPINEQVIFFTTQDKKYGYTALHVFYNNFSIQNDTNNIRNINNIMNLLYNEIGPIEDFRGNFIKQN